MMFDISTQYATLRFGGSTSCHGLLDRSSLTNYLATEMPALVSVRAAGMDYPATTFSREGDHFTFDLADAGTRVVLRITAEARHFLIEVVDVQGTEIEALTFLDLPLALHGVTGEPFAVCALALNLLTNVPEIPGPMVRPRATCAARIGFVGAKVALIACPPSEMRAIMQEVVAAAPDLPQSALGGPWAADAPINRGSYLFNMTGLTEETVDDWIALAKCIGFTQIDFHGGQSFRFGDCEPNPALYPDGRQSLKRVIDRLHDAGLVAGLHTYAFFMDKACPWVTPVPDHRLGSDAIFSLSAPVPAAATTVPVDEPTDMMSTITGFFVRNSVTLRIDDELITYAGVGDKVFTDCTRGAWGTTPAAHAAGAKVYHLKECFGLFTPDGDNSLLGEVAAATAQTFNECGFDMMYLDALDGEDILGGREYSWHYGSKFVFEICQRLERPALLEMSTFHHHLWFVRSRFGAWDHPNRAHKTFIDVHMQSNARGGQIFLPGQLGWWAHSTFSDQQTERTFSDVHEYLCAKAAASDTGFALMGIDTSTLANNPAMRGTADILRRWENLRHSGMLTPAIKARLGAPREEFTLRQDERICPVRYDKRKVEGAVDRWTVENPFAAQPLCVRIEALHTAEPESSPEARIIADYTDPLRYADRKTARGVTVDLQPSGLRADAGLLTARNDDAPPRAAWAGLRQTFSPPLDLGYHQALGVWVYGDGQGEVLNVQLRSPVHISNAVGEHYIIIDFIGWRYFTLIEPEGDRYADYRWPYAIAEEEWQNGTPPDVADPESYQQIMGGYHVLRENVHYAHVESLSLWLNNLPVEGEVACHLGPILALPLRDSPIHFPAVTVDGVTARFPVTLHTGEYLQADATGHYAVYDRDGAEIAAGRLPDPLPHLQGRGNEIAFACNRAEDVDPRAQVTVIMQGEPL